MADQPGLPGPGRDSVTTGLLGDRQTFEKALAEFKSFTDNFENIISSVLEVERLAEYEDEDEYGHTNLYSTLPAHLQQCLTGDFHPVWPRMRSGPKPTPRAG